MSWMKRRTPTAAPSPGPLQTPPPVQMYNPNQHSTPDWQQQQPNNWYNQPSMPTVTEQAPQQNIQPYWQQQHQYPTQQQLQQQQQYNYGNHISQSQPNNYYQQQQQPLQQQKFSSQQSFEYNNSQYNYQSNNYIPSQQPPQPQMQQQHGQQQQQQQQPNDWNNAWGWGDEDNSNHANVINNVQNANTVQDSFNDESWNWNVEDSSAALQSTQIKSESTLAEIGSNPEAIDVKPDQQLFPKMGDKVPKPENLETVPMMPSLPLNRRIKSEQLTPQWSIESQVSQESSDDILQTSESDKLFSRSSTISHSPVSGHHTPQEVPQVEKSQEQYTDNNCENKEIISNVKEEKDSKPPSGLLPVPGSSSDNLYKKNNTNASGNKRTTPPEARSFYMPMPNQTVNLETVPDNSEAPDFQSDVHPPAAVTPLENNEVAPLNERNQYLETGQLSDENDALPPPGLSRMVLGQFGQGDVNEPPPGLSRMVLGQTESAQPMASPPVGLHRMIPGESSSPEVRYDEEEVSDPELQQISRNPMQSRSATIGADTPPAPPSNSHEQVERETHLDGANIQDSTTTTDLDTLTSSVRDLTVGENTSDSRQPSDSIRRLETDSDVDRPQSPHEGGRKERRHKDDPRRDYARDSGRDAPRTDRRRNRDRNYEDDTDYFSDKERDRRRAREDSDRDRKYSSLKRTDRDNKDRRRRDERERDRPSDRRSEYRRGPERDYYYNRYEEDFDDHRSSRPSSRSDSMHESFYRERGHERDRRRDRERDRDPRRHRDPYNAYKMAAYPYDPYNPYYQQYQYYLENLRRTDPQAYAEWYRKYYQQTATANAGYTPEEKPSVHSGRSSTNDDLAKERYFRQNYYGHAGYSQMGGYYREPHSVSSGHYGLEDSRPYDYTDSSLILEDTTVSQRLTPAKFSTAHIKASVTSGRLVKILPHYPMDGQTALVELDRLQEYLQADDELLELEQFPGPLVRGVTHKKTIIEYCNNKIRDRDSLKEIDDPESYVLMWELLILLIRQNGMVVGADIAELLMKDRSTESLIPRPPSVASNSSGIVEASESSNIAEASGSSAASFKEEYVTSKFREYLIYGSGQQALEWAMKHSLWGHALFLASKLDKRTYAKVMTRFANGLPINDPLQTLYQLLSGHLPAAVTSVGDEKWGDWRPHLAMILSNTTQRPELDRKAITTLADTLMSRGSLHAAQFCYLMAEVGFSRYGQEGKLVLLGGDATKPFQQFAHNEAIHMTEIYEYACSLNDPAFKIPEFQAYKYLMATRLCDRGYLEDALAYVEQVADALAAIPTLTQPSLINKVCDLAERLKYYDAADYNEADEAAMDGERPDQPWLHTLKTIQQQYTMGLISHESVNNLSTTTPDTISQQQGQNYDPSPQDPWTTQYQDNLYSQQATTWSQPSAETNDYNLQQFQPQELSTENYNTQQYQEQIWNQQPQQMQQQQQQQQESYNQQSQDLHASQLDQSNAVQQANNDYWNNAQIEEQPRPQISMPNQGRQQRTSISEDKHFVKSSGASASKPKELEKKATNASSTGWFGGIWSKLALRPKNQMKLPDDKNPTIVWDQEKKRWVNLEDDHADAASELRPPPKMSDLMPTSQQHMPQLPSLQPQSLPNLNTYGMSTTSQPQNLDAHPQNDGKPPLPSQNIFKMQRNRNLKKSYVDVFNPSGKAPSPEATDFQAPAMPTSNAAPMNFFVPAPMDPNAPLNFLTPSNMAHQDHSAQLHQS